MVKKFAVINDNFVENVVLAEDEYASTQGWIECPDDVCPGYIYQEGNFLAPPPVVIVPKSVSPRQIRLLLLQQNLLESVETLIAQQSADVQIAWQYATEYYRDDPLLLQLATDLQLTSEQLDQFFIEASKL